MAVAGLCIVGAFIFVGIFGGFLARYPPRSLQPLYEGESGEPPSWEHPFGTTSVGVDVLSEVIQGTRNDLYVGITSTAVSMLIAIVVGSIAGYYGGRIDNVLMRLTEIFLVFPSFVLILVFSRILTLLVVKGYGLLIIIVIIAIFGWPGHARMIRGEFLRVRELEFVQAEKALGVPDRKIIFRHLLPNTLSPVIVVATLSIAYNIILEAAIGFLGFGDPNTTTWGILLQEGYTYLRAEWWGEVFPGIAVLLCVLGFNIMGDGLSDALNPRFRE
jgi:ABC-type dipeptide/oligopeptide/nickel transport system permease subunit